MDAGNCTGQSTFDRQSSEGVVDELLSCLLSRVCEEEQEFQPLPRSQSVDVCQTVLFHSPQHVLGGYCEREGGWELLQVECVDQKASGYCGHYCLFLAILCLQLHNCVSHDEALILLQKTCSTVHFWRRYWVSVGGLLAHVQAHPEVLWWPWTLHHVMLGEMERSYLTYLLTFDPSLTALGGRQKISVVHFAYGCVLNSTEEIMKLQETIEELRRSRGHHVFILGVTNHWVTLYAYHRTQPERGRHPLALIYWDSNNVTVIGASDNDILQVVDKKEKERLRVKGRAYSSWKKAVFTQALCDQRDVVTLLARCLSGQEEFAQRALCGHWNTVLTSFQEHVSREAKSEEDLFLPLLLQWLETQHQPGSLRDHQVHMLMELGAECLSKEIKTRMKDWLQDCATKLADYHGGIPLVDSFSAVLQQLKEFFY